MEVLKFSVDITEVLKDLRVVAKRKLNTLLLDVQAATEEVLERSCPSGSD